MEGLIKEAQFEEEMRRRVEPFLAENRNKGTLAVSQTVALHYEWYHRERARGNVLLLHG